MKIKLPVFLASRRARWGALAALASILVVLALSGRGGEPAKPVAPLAAKTALTVTMTRPQTAEWPQRLVASGNIAAWQEAIIGAEISNYRITEVRAQVGDMVRKGQLLVQIDPSTVASEVAEARAVVSELEATLAEARANSERARQLRERGFYSPQQNTQSQTIEQTAAARLNAARARLQAAELRLARTRIVAPDDGVISAQIATVGSLTQPGEELLRLIRGGRLEWRAEVTASELGAMQAGLPAILTAPNGERVAGRVRALAPTVDAQTRNGLVYVDLPPEAGKVFGAGMFARGEFELGVRSALTVPQSAVVLREGFSYVFVLEGEHAETARVALTKVTVGRRQGDRIEITGIDAAARVVASGAGFLADGDNVRIVAQDKAAPTS